ncbi:hypothetical protein Sste5344_000645 [Sporothrix stenoceras]
MSKWEGSMKDDLLMALFSYCPPNAEQKVQIVAYLDTKGHNITWDAIRFAFAVSFHTQFTILPFTTSSSPSSLTMSAEKRFAQDWNAPGVYRDILVAMVEEYKPPAATLKMIVENMNKLGHQFTYRGLE